MSVSTSGGTWSYGYDARPAITNKQVALLAACVYNLNHPMSVHRMDRTLEIADEFEKWLEGWDEDDAPAGEQQGDGGERP